MHWSAVGAAVQLGLKQFLSCIATPQGIVAIETHWGASSKKWEYLHKDHLGSTDVVTDQTGAVLQKPSFDAFGKRRSALNWKDAGPATSSVLTAKGYTGHEQIDDLELIHMNGRVYDPVIGRFVSADPIIQAPENTQSYNRYSYVMNNPLSYTDPSGYSRLSRALKKAGRWIGDNWRTLAAVAIAVVTYGASSWATAAYGGWAGAGVAATGGFAAGMVASGGDLRAGVIAALSAAAFYGIGQALGEVTYADVDKLISKAVLHGSVGGFQTAASGGKFGQGFLTAGVGALAAPGLANAKLLPNDAARITAAAVVGGTVSELGEGKFANGAITAAFAYALNQAMSGFSERMRAEAAKQNAKSAQEQFYRSDYAKQGYSDFFGELSRASGTATGLCLLSTACAVGTAGAVPALTTAVSIGSGLLSRYLDPTPTHFENAFFVKDVAVSFSPAVLRSAFPLSAPAIQAYGASVELHNAAANYLFSE